MKPIRNNNLPRRIVTVICLLSMAGSFSYLAYYVAGCTRRRQMENEVYNMYASEYASKGIASQACSVGHSLENGVSAAYTGMFEPEGFGSFFDTNPDFLGIISIPGLGIKLPFVQGDDNEYYLHNDFYGKSSPHGAIFLDFRNSPSLSDHNNVLYGHNMRDGSMFHRLSEYAGDSGVQNAPVIYIDRPEGRSEWLVFAAYVCRADCGYFDTEVFGESFESFIESARSRSLCSTGVDVNAGDTILTLSTCNYSFENARFAVHARKKRPDE